MFRGILWSGLRRRASSESACGLWIFAFWQIGLVKLIPPGCNFGSLRYAKRHLLGGRIACGSDQPDKRQTEMSVCLSGFFVFWRSLGMDFLNRSIKSIYFKYLSAAFGSAMISSVYSIVDVAMVGQYTRVRQALRPWRWWLRCGISSTVWGLLMGIGGSVIFSACRGGASSSGGRRWRCFRGEPVFHGGGIVGGGFGQRASQCKGGIESGGFGRGAQPKGGIVAGGFG